MIDLTDEIAYNTADLDDGYESRLLAYDQIRDGVPVFARFAAEVEKLYPDVAEKLKFNETVKRFLNRLVGDLIENTKANTAILRGTSKPSKTCAATPQRLAAFSPTVEEERKQAKSFLYENLYYSPSLAPEKDDAERVITELFAFWMKDPSALPHNYREKLEEDPLPRVICDYIAGMTDNYIYEQYDKFCRPLEFCHGPP